MRTFSHIFNLKNLDNPTIPFMRSNFYGPAVDHSTVMSTRGSRNIITGLSTPFDFFFQAMIIVQLTEWLNQP